jgi:GH24 family phage-related lysozyme (muramidase)
MKFEGWRDKPYKDSVGVPTIGWGFNLTDPVVASLIPEDVKQGKRALSQAEALPIFNKLYSRAEQTARDYIGDKFDKLPEQIKDVVIDMSYNMGDRINQFGDMKRAILSGDTQEIGFAMRDSKWFKQVGNRSKQHFATVTALENY